MAIKKDDVRKALNALEAASPELAKGEGEDLNDANGAATEGGGDGKLKAPGDDMPKKYGVTKTKKSMAKPAPEADDEEEEDDEDEDGEDDEHDEMAGEKPAKKSLGCSTDSLPGMGKKKKAKKSFAKADHDGDGDDDDSEEGDMDHDFAGKKKAKKSMPSSFFDSVPDEITTKVDVSNFLRSLVDHTAVTVDGLRDSIIKSDAANDQRVEALYEALESVQKSQSNIGVVLQAICERIGVIENQPATVAKSQRSDAAPQRQAAPVSRTFVENSDVAGGESQPGLYKSLAGRPAHVAKAMVSEAICGLVRKGEAADTDVINFETYGYVPPELDAKLRSVLN